LGQQGTTAFKVKILGWGYLLRRDLDPANDNAPVGLNQVA